MTAKMKRCLRSAAAAVTAAAISLCPPARTAFCRAVGQAAILSAALSMPDGAFALLRERYLPQEEGQTTQPPAQSLPQSQSQSPAPPESSGEDFASSLPPPPEDIPDEDIPRQYRGKITERSMTGEDTGAFCKLTHGYIRNYTELSPAEVRSIAAQPPALAPYNGDGPQVLIYHTHATESFEARDSEIYDTRSTWRSTDDAVNIVAVGAALAEALEARGVLVLHDTTQHDNPSYSGAYERSGETIADYLERYPSVRVLLDIHRDAINITETEIAKITAVVEGRKAAQLMIIAPCDADGSLGIPLWKENLRFAAGLTDAIEARYPGLTRPVFFCPRSYNYDSSPGALLLEFGASGNTLEEALYTAELIAPITAEYLAALP